MDQPRSDIPFFKFNLKSLILVSLLSGPIICYFYLNWPNDNEEAKRAVAVAARDLDRLEQVLSQNVRIESWRVSLIPPQATSNCSDIVGRFTTSPIPEGTPILVSNVKAFTEIVDSHLDIEIGRNVMSVKCQVASGLPSIGDRVDLYSIQGNEGVVIARLVRVAELYGWNNDNTCRLGLELSDNEALMFLQAKQKWPISVVPATE